MLATELYALSQGRVCAGSHLCHWCGAPCTAQWLHDEPPPVPFTRTRTTAKRPGDPHVCVGCWLFRRPRVTVVNLGGRYFDGKHPPMYSWWIWEKTAKVILHEDHGLLWALLRKPPHRFALSLVETSVPTLLHTLPCNDHQEIGASTPLHFAVNGIPHTYTVYELEHALRYGTDGTEPGVQALFRLLHSRPVIEEDEPAKKGRGRPRGEDTEVRQTVKVVRPRSG